MLVPRNPILIIRFELGVLASVLMLDDDFRRFGRPDILLFQSSWYLTCALVPNVLRPLASSQCHDSFSGLQHQFLS